MNQHKRKPRILFVAEAATLAHVVRPIVLAQSLNRDKYDIYFACDPRYLKLFPDLPFPVREIYSAPSKIFLRNLALGLAIFNAKTLRRYVQEELEVIKEIDPDLIIGDLRFSLSVSTRLTNKSYITLTNAYWSPYIKQLFIVPDLPLVRFLPIKVAQFLFNIVCNLGFALHSLPINKIRSEYKLSPLKSDFRSVITYGDYVLYTDIPELVPINNLPKDHKYIGPIFWSPNVELPSWWDDLPTQKSIIYLNLGSSGKIKTLPKIIQTIAELPVTIMVATAGRMKLSNLSSNVFIADYLPGDMASAKADLVICNGGSPSTFQALAHGVPVIGIASNSDQYQNMSFLEKAGVGILLRSNPINSKMLIHSIQNILGNDSYHYNALKIKDYIAEYKDKKIDSIISVILNKTNQQNI